MRKKLLLEDVPTGYTPDCQAVLNAALNIIRAGSKIARDTWIKKSHAQGYTPTELAEVTGLTRVHIYAILKRDL